MAYTLGQVVSSVFNRSFGERQHKPAHKSPPAAKKPAARTTVSGGVVVTLSAEAQAALAEMRENAPQDFMLPPLEIRPRASYDHES